MVQWGDEQRKPWDVGFRELVEGEPLMGFLILAGALQMEPGEWLPAVSDAVPEVLRYVEDGRAPERSRVLYIVEMVARAARVATVDERWPAVWGEAVQRLIALLDDSAEAVRRAAGLALAEAPEPEIVLDALLDRFSREEADSVRAGLVVAIGEVGGESVLPWLAERTNEAALAVAAWVSIARIGGEVPVDRFVDALCGDPAPYDGLHGIDSSSDLLEWAVEPLTPESQTEVLIALTANPAFSTAVRTVAGELATDRPLTAEALVPVFGRLLETSERGWAAARLGDLAPASAGYADRLFALIDDAGPAEKLGKFVVAEVRDMALWALLKLRDRRAVAPQLALCTERMRAERPFIGSGWLPSPPGEVPILRDLFGHAPEFADEVLPWVLDLLPDCDAMVVLQVTRLLTDWGPVAAPAVPQLAPALGSEDPRAVEWCADALRVIGVADGQVLDALAEATHRRELPWAARSAAATAFAVLGGDQAAADELLAEGLARGEGATVERLAALGPAAAHHVPALRAFDCSRPADEVAVARALARLTGDAAEAVPVLLGVLAEMKPKQAYETEGAAVRGLLELGPLPAATAPLLRRILATDERLTLWGDVPRERAFRRDVARLLANCG
ncbi:HEAT repeat domain-containing protein [Amycolatopsis sp. MtRt-6]|uniref:HEAT repeat domain-containing protein n=1 Tax=Amycolatopsis sp. MtRt-6 TaxID=2792782 RepID=UPI001A8E8F8A|nr:HEAT repeat domain-containing protein [Amycolatopsis sp. MtRt-6]